MSPSQALRLKTTILWNSTEAGRSYYSPAREDHRPGECGCYLVKNHEPMWTMSANGRTRGLSSFSLYDVSLFWTKWGVHARSLYSQYSWPNVLKVLKQQKMGIDAGPKDSVLFTPWVVGLRLLSLQPEKQVLPLHPRWTRTRWTRKKRTGLGTRQF